MGTIIKRPVSSSGWEIDPLLKDFSEKKQSFRRNVVSLAAELKDARTRLALQEQSCVQETQSRQQAEAKNEEMEAEVCRLHKTLEERNKQLQATASYVEKYLEDLDDLRFQLLATKATADASSASAQAADMKCSALLNHLNQKNDLVKKHENGVKLLAEQVDILQRDLQARESSQKQRRDEVRIVGHDILKVLDEVCPKNFEDKNKILSEKDEEIEKLKDEIKALSAVWKLKTVELENQVEKYRKVDQELKKRVLQLEFCLHEACSQTRKLLRMGERRDRTIKELRDELAKQQQSHEKESFWESTNFKILISMSMVVLVVFSCR